jgi:hypothetical protein
MADIMNGANPAGGDPAYVVPWEPANIPNSIQSEFRRRQRNRSFRYVENSRGDWNSDTGDWSKSKGPMSPWVRLCSNSKGTDKIGKPGFVFFGGKGFYSDYGFTKDKTNPSIIGYVPSKGMNPHIINNDLNEQYPVHVPAPEIERIQVTIQKELYRRASVEWVCFSQKQLEYMTPYFLIPGISCIMEWGWNLYNPESLVDLTNVGELERIFNNPYSLYTKNIMKSRGNYDVIFGIITNFEWTADGNKFRCKTEITSKDRIYAGLIVDSSTADKSSTEEKEEISVKIFNSLVQFVDKTLDKFRGVLKTPPDSIPELMEFTNYVRATHKNKGNADEYLYGVFHGRDQRQEKFQSGRSDKDFDRKTEELWLNLGLVIDAINFHARPAKGTRGKEMLRVDIDDVVVSAHPNMISSNGSICFIPNFEAPKYFYGQYGYNSVTTAFNGNPSDYDKLKLADSSLKATLSKSKARKKSENASPAGLADWRLYTVCLPIGDEVKRDDIDQIINAIRYEKGIAAGSCCFPFKASTPSPANPQNLYPAHYSGYLKHIYVSLSFLKDLLNNSSDITTYYQFVVKILEGVNSACGGFWDLRLVSGAGDATVPPDEPAPMKIIDYKFMFFSNRGKVWSFDYFDADSLLLGIGFKPTLSNAQAIRTIYAPTNNPDNKTIIINGNNELLDYKFSDRLKLGENVGNAPTQRADTSGFDDTMRVLQQIDPCDKNVYQITTDNHVYRLVMPATDIQQLLLDDSDEENNPKYTGIMPGIQATFTIQGIGGLRTFMMFLVRNLPEPYSEKNTIFRIVDVQETVEAGKWTTQITAGVIPLREHIKARLGIKS